MKIFVIFLAGVLGDHTTMSPMCDYDPCHAEAICTPEWSVNGYRCDCKRGYYGDGVNFCRDNDECLLAIDNCPIGHKCTNTIGSYKCGCDEGFSGDGYTCENIDECELQTHTCDENARCTDTVGSFECACKNGYSGDGFNCDREKNGLTDFDNCETPVKPENAKPVSCSGSTCSLTCKRGFRATGRKHIKCRRRNGEFSWNGELGRCVGCHPLEAAQGATQTCSVHGKGLFSCRQETNDDGNYFWINNQRWNKLVLNCRCAKLSDGPERECAFKNYRYGKVTQQDIDAFYIGARAPTTTRPSTTRPTTTRPTTTRPTTTRPTTTRPTTTRPTTTRPTTTRPTTTRPTTTARRTTMTTRRPTTTRPTPTTTMTTTRPTPGQPTPGQPTPGQPWWLTTRQPDN